MTEDQAKEIAQKFVARDAHRFRYELIEARQAESLPDDWSIVFEVKTLDGNAIVGPLVILVNKATSLPRALG